MRFTGLFSHFSPIHGIITPLDRYLWGLRETQATLPRSVLVGENLYRCNISNAESVALGHQPLMNSPHHRDNILDSRFARVGIGIYHDTRGGFWVTQMFLQAE